MNRPRPRGGSSSRPILLVFAALIIGGVLYLRLRPHQTISVRDATSAGNVGCSQVAAAYRGRDNATWLTLRAPISRLLSDADGKYRHQRFIVRCPTGQTVLIVNDVSIGERVPARVGDIVAVRGRYFYNARGGLVDFTHHDDTGGNGGWILDHGNIYSLGHTGTPSITIS